MKLFKSTFILLVAVALFLPSFFWDYGLNKTSLFVKKVHADAPYVDPGGTGGGTPPDPYYGGQGEGCEGQGGCE